MSLRGRTGAFKFTYRVVDVDWDSPLGRGSYGVVYKAKCDELQCAAKVIHETLLIGNLTDYQGQGEERILENFHRECHFLSELRHPNIVQYLGTHLQEESLRRNSNLILLMELMEQSLTHYLENSDAPLPLYLEINICHDVALAISYLHSNHIVHRDLTGNNVLLDAGRKAKVTNFGVSRLIDPDTLQRSSLSLHPGTSAYMPPEALEEVQSPHYTEKLDCFSYGVLCIQIFTRQFPNPTSRYRSVDEETSINIRAVVSERTRRENHINMVQDDHIFKLLVLACLSDSQIDRPTSQELCHNLTLLKTRPEYVESKANSGLHVERRSESNERDRDTIRHLERDLNQSRTLSSQLQQDLDSLHGNHRQEITHKNNEILRLNERIQGLTSRLALAEQRCNKKVQDGEQKEAELNRTQSTVTHLQSELKILEMKLGSKDDDILKLENKIRSLQKELSYKTTLLEEFQEKKESIMKLQLLWREGPEACTKLRREPDAVPDNDVVYFKYFWGINIFAYNIAQQSWAELPDCPVSSFSMAVLDGMLTIIGGKSSDLAPVSTLYSYAGSKWVQKFPNMHTERYWTMSTRWNYFLIVMGGEGRDRQVLDVVEVLNLQTQQWSFASSLPRAMDSAASAICGDDLYVGGGSHANSARYIAVCSLPHLLENLHEEKLSIGVALSLKELWKQIDDLPYFKTCLTSVESYLFAVGGKDELEQPTSAVYVYNSPSKKWQKVSEMKYARSSCYAVSLPNNEIMVVGGINKDTKVGTKVEIARLKSHERVQ